MVKHLGLDQVAILNLIFTICSAKAIFLEGQLNFSLKFSSEMAIFCFFDDNMQMRLRTSLKPKYSKVFKFKRFHIKSRPPKGGGWALGPMLGKQD